jgi:polyphosphate glucokinase
MATKTKNNILAIDVGGTNVKIRDQNHADPVKIPSGKLMTSSEMVKQVKSATTGWGFTHVSIGYPGPVLHNSPALEPHNIGGGWVGFDFEKGFGCPVRVVNDAAMQAIGSYEGGRMLFLGLGTGLGSALIVDGVVAPLELAHLPYKNGMTYEEYVGVHGLERLGKADWRKHVNKVAILLKNAMVADYVILGGGNARLIKELPPNMELGDNSKAILGGFRLWEGIPKTGAKSPVAAPVKSGDSGKWA